MSDRIDEIRARLDAHNNGDGIYATLEMQSHAPADIAWLLDELNRVWDYVYHRHSCAVVESPANKCDCGLAELESGKP